MSRLSSKAPTEVRTDFDGRAASDAHRANHLVFVDPASVELSTLLDRVAPSAAPVRLAGETGTGKELVARYIHRNSGRSGPFLAVNCGAIAEHLAESELFGHEAGSFTGATVRREGWFEAAHGGTLFLDEVGDLPMVLQVKLLRVLQEGEVTRVGSRRPVTVDVRIIAATNVDLAQAVEAGRFRRDLFYRLSIVPVHIPALRDRPRDIAALTDHFVRRYSVRLSRPIPSLSAEAMDRLRAHPWPGNIRELENAVHYTLLTCAEEVIEAKDLQLAETAQWPAPARRGQGTDEKLRGQLREVFREYFHSPGSNLLRDFEQQVVSDAFEFCDSNQVRTAELLGVTRNVVRTLLKRYELIDDGAAAPEPELLRGRALTMVPRAPALQQYSQ